MAGTAGVAGAESCGLPQPYATGEEGNHMWAVWRVKEEGEAYRRVPVWAVVAVVHPSRWGWLGASGMDLAGMV